MTGAPTFIAMSITLQIFCAWRSDSEPPNTVKSWAKTNTRRPLIVPDPVTTPSPGIFCPSMPKSTQLCSTYMSYSSNEPGSSSTVSRSRAVRRPFACCASILFSPPRRRAAARRRSSSSMVVPMAGSYSRAGGVATNPPRGRGGLLSVEGRLALLQKGEDRLLEIVGASRLALGDALGDEGVAQMQLLRIAGEAAEQAVGNGRS